LCFVSDTLKVTPWLDYHYAYSFGNYVKIDPKGDLKWENLSMACSFTGLPDECGFIMVHVDINSFSPGIVDGVMRVGDSMRAAQGKEKSTKENMEQLCMGLKIIRDTMTSMNRRYACMQSFCAMLKRSINFFVYMLYEGGVRCGRLRDTTTTTTSACSSWG
jgi:hypothetical protein